MSKEEMKELLHNFLTFADCLYSVSMREYDTESQKHELADIDEIVDHFIEED